MQSSKTHRHRTRIVAVIGSKTKNPFPLRSFQYIYYFRSRISKALPTTFNHQTETEGHQHHQTNPNKPTK
jgi:hypothetical protein